MRLNNGSSGAEVTVMRAKTFDEDLQIAPKPSRAKLRKVIAHLWAENHLKTASSGVRTRLTSTYPADENEKETRVRFEFAFQRQ